MGRPGQAPANGSHTTLCKSKPSRNITFLTFYRWSSNQQLLSSSCSQYGAANNSPDEISAIQSAIQAQASSSGVDPRFILAIILQESGGCVRVPTSNGGVVNPGLMQTHAGTGTCAGVSPCPSSMISQMVQDGASGTPAGDGLKQCLAQASAGGASDATAVYRAARIYNTGSYTAGSDLGTPEWGTSCYSTDVANRLTGWSGLQTSCTLPNPQH